MRAPTDLAAELEALERALAARDGSGVPGGLASLLADDFAEFGASGRRWDRVASVAALESAVTRPVDVTGFAVRHLAPDIVLATYEIAVGSAPDVRRSLRSSVWARSEGSWQVRFHQGTPISEPGS